MGSSDNEFLGESEAASVIYHDIFDYPLSAKEIIKWQVGKKGLKLFTKTKEVLSKDGLYFLKGKQNLLYKKALRERASDRKTGMAIKNASLLARLPLVKGVFITGALAMNNAKEESDIDLMIITETNLLWLTRLVILVLLVLFHIPFRRAGRKDERDKLCLNIWLDESTLSWDKKDRNIYSAHEIAQIRPIVDKDNIYQRLLQKNKWILDYWPNAAKPQNIKLRIMNYAKNPLYIILNSLFLVVNLIAFKLQYLYMKPKITCEVVTLHKAIFHPRNWSKMVLDRLKIYL